jgi:uncharacterized protein (DUF983 family)
MRERPHAQLLLNALKCRCPACGEGGIYAHTLRMATRDNCPVCGHDFGRSDTADAPAVFLIFVLGFVLVPMAIWLEVALSPPLWLHGALWTGVALGLTLGMLKPVKAYILGLHYMYRGNGR